MNGKIPSTGSTPEPDLNADAVASKQDDHAGENHAIGHLGAIALTQEQEHQSIGHVHHSATSLEEGSRSSSASVHLEGDISHLQITENKKRPRETSSNGSTSKSVRISEGSSSQGSTLPNALEKDSDIDRILRSWTESPPALTSQQIEEDKARQTIAFNQWEPVLDEAEASLDQVNAVSVNAWSLLEARTQLHRALTNEEEANYAILSTDIEAAFNQCKHGIASIRTAKHEYEKASQASEKIYFHTRRNGLLRRSNDLLEQLYSKHDLLIELAKEAHELETTGLSDNESSDLGSEETI